MAEKILIPLFENDVAPRFDLATEVLIITGTGPYNSREKKTVVLPRASAEQLCHFILTEGIQTVICNGVADDYYHYLTWKRINVIDAVIGSCRAVLEQFIAGTLKSGQIVA